MKVLHLNDKISNQGGVEVYIAQLMHLLPQYQWEAVWMGIQPGEDQAYEAQLFPNEQPCFRGDIQAWTEYLGHFIEEAGIDLIHIHSLSDPALIEACFSLLPVIRSMHDPRLFCPGQGKFWRFSEQICTQPAGWHCLWHAYTQGCCNRHPKRLWAAFRNTRFEIQHASRRYARLIAMSDFMKSEAVAAGILGKQIQVNPYFTMPVQNPSEASDDPKRILYVGRFIPHKGIHLMLKAMLPLLKSYPKLVIDLVGDGMHYPALKAELEAAERLGVSDRILQHGWQSQAEIEAFFRQAYLVVFPSIYPEAFGIVGIEAMMHAKPVVGFEVGGVSSWLENEKTGYLVSAGAVEEMSKRVAQLLQDPVLYAGMCAQARARALEAFLPKAHMEKLIAVYEAAA